MSNLNSNLYKDVINGLLYVAGIFGFISGAFIISTVLFGAAAIISNIDVNRKALA